MAQRTGPIVDFPYTDAAAIIERLRATLGRLTALFSLTLLAETSSGTAIAAAASTDLPTTSTTVDLDDAGVDQVRVHAYAGTTGGAGIAVLVFDSTNGRELCRVAITAGANLYTGDWTPVPPVGGDAVLKVRVLGNGVNTQTLYNVRLEGRTTKFTA